MASATVSEILQACADELDVNLTNEKVKRQLLWWLNTVYQEVVESEEYDWRRYDATLQLKGLGGENLTFGLANGSTNVNVTLTSSLMYLARIGRFSVGNPIRFSTEDELYYIGEYITGTPTTCRLTLTQAYAGSTGVKTGTVYHAMYDLECSKPSGLAGIHEDWITHVYLASDSRELPRIYPSDNELLTRYLTTNPGSPEVFFTKGLTQTNGTVIGFSPTPSDSAVVTVSLMHGATELVEGDGTTILPAGIDKPVLVYGTGLLYCISHKDREGVAFYSERLQKWVDTLRKKSLRAPGRASRLVGHIANRVKWDRELPLDGWFD